MQADRAAATPQPGFVMRLLLVIVLVCGTAATAMAHDPGLSTADLRFEGGQLLAHLTFAKPDIEPLLPRDDILDVRVDGTPVAARQTTMQANASNALEIWMRFPLQVGRCVAIRSPLLGDLAFGHREYLAVRDSNGGMFTQQMLSASNDRIELSLSAAQPASHSFSKRLALGIEHILMGHYHLPFLFALLLVGGIFCVRGRGKSQRLHLFTGDQTKLDTTWRKTSDSPRLSRS
jgi:hypothetical protein